MNPYRTPGKPGRDHPGFIRYFAETSGSPLGVAAFEYCRTLMRIAPVRVVTMTGTLSGRWMGYMSLLTTPMLEPYVNAVCCAPERWTWLAQIPMPENDVDLPTQALMGGVSAAEVAKGWLELYTTAVRNVMFVPGRDPHTLSKVQLAAATKYEALIVDNEENARQWRDVGGHPRVVATPVTDHAQVREAILG